MAKFRSKTEVYFTPELEEKLELFQRDLSGQLGKKVSKNAMVNEIVSHFFRISQPKDVLPTKNGVVEEVPQQSE